MIGSEGYVKMRERRKGNKGGKNKRGNEEEKRRVGKRTGKQWLKFVLEFNA